MDMERLVPVTPAFYAMLVRETVKDPWERIRLLFNAGFRGADLK